jgi:CDP-diacylglycerol--glycerol-3-phosphate 3-phosphatidyltransferase
MNFANKISTFRILCVPFFIASLIYYYNYPQKHYLKFIALFIFLLGVLSDAVDGYIARKAKQFSEAGLILDPLGDKLLLMSAFICLFFFPSNIKFPLWVTLVVVSRDTIILLGALIIFMVKKNVHIFPTRGGKFTTVFQVLAVIAVLLQIKFAYVFWSIAVFFTILSGVIYIKRGFKVLYGLDNFRNTR